MLLKSCETQAPELECGELWYSLGPTIAVWAADTVQCLLHGAVCFSVDNLYM